MWYVYEAIYHPASRLTKDRLTFTFVKIGGQAKVQLQSGKNAHGTENYNVLNADLKFSNKIDLISPMRIV